MVDDHAGSWDAQDDEVPWVSEPPDEEFSAGAQVQGPRRASLAPAIRPAPPSVYGSPVRLPVTVPLVATGAWDHQSGHTLGISVLATGLGTTIGALYGGLGGGIAGALAAGSAVNLLRAYKFYGQGTEEGTKEAMVSLTYAILVAASSGFVWWKFGGRGRMVRNPDDVRVAEDTQAICSIRKVGP
jgi:hypothetical protein